MFNIQDMKNAFHKLFVKSIPSDSVRSFPLWYMYIFGWCLNIFMVSFFVYFFYQGYMDSVTQKFLSLQSSAGICERVLKPANGEYLGDYNGYWEGDEDFSYVDGMYRLTFQNYLATPEYFANSMVGEGSDTLESFMKAFGALATTQNLAQNLLLWFSLSLQGNVGGAIQIFRMAGDPSATYNQMVHSGGIGDYHCDCNAPSVSAFDPGSNKLSITYEYDVFMNNTNCSSLIDPVGTFGYSPSRHGNDFKIAFDVRSLVIAAGVNIRLSLYENLVAVPGYDVVFDHVDGSVVYLDMFYDPRYPGMVRKLLGIILSLYIKYVVYYTYIIYIYYIYIL